MSVLAIVVSLSGFFGACNEVFGIDQPQPLDKGASGAGGTGVAGSTPSKGGAGPSTGGASAGSANGGKGNAGNAGSSSAEGGSSRGGSSNGGGSSANGGSDNGGSGNGGTGGSDGGAGDTGGSDAGSDQGGNGGTGGSTNGGSTNAGNGGTAGVAAGNGGMAGGGMAGVGGTPLGPCDGLGLPGPALVYIAADNGKIGADDIEQSPGNTACKPEHNQNFPDAFCVDKTEVTVAQYRACVNASACTVPTGTSCNWSTSPGSKDDHPVTCMSQAKSIAYCSWAGKRLPTELEWEFVARGPNGNKYPWGSTAPETTAISNPRLNWNNIVGDTKPVGSYPAGQTAAGVMDMSGNAWEWTSSLWCDSWSTNPAPACTSDPVARGGSYASTFADHVRPAWRDPSSNGDGRFGFRCVHDPN